MIPIISPLFKVILASLKILIEPNEKFSLEISILLSSKCLTSIFHEFHFEIIGIIFSQYV